VCHQCGDTCHWKRNCPQNLAELLKNMKLSQGASGSGIFTIVLYTFPNKSWVYDTGCGTYICNTTQGLRGSRKLKPRALSLYVGNGQRATVEAIRAYHLCLPSGLVIVLNNYHYAPSITRGIISVSRLYDDGYVNHFVDTTIQVSRNNMVYFSVVLRDGIFEIDLSNPNAIDSFIYVHKHEVFETFKVFQKEVENQLGKTIKLLRSDHRGEYMSQEFLDHLNEHGIIAYRTPPYTTQHNGVSERRNRTLLDMVRSMMSQTTLPKSFWDYALETAARILNMVPTKKVDKTPYEVWHGQAAKLSYLKVWVCKALVKRDTLTKPDTQRKQ
ncbi:retrotransposon protein, putative, ty1-copia subclass, partial [Tanacetum coccineum]